MTEVINFPCIQKKVYIDPLTSCTAINRLLTNNIHENELLSASVDKLKDTQQSEKKMVKSDLRAGNIGLAKDCTTTEIRACTELMPALDKDRCSSEIQCTIKKERLFDYKVLICPYCEKKFEDESTLDKHKEIHVGEWPFTCHVCHKGFLLRHLLESHASYHKNEVFPCDSCDKKCVSRYKLKLHMRMHINHFICRICKESFPTNECLKRHKSSHKRTVVKKPIYICKICSAKFPVHIELKIHLRMHSTDWPFSCDVCKKLYRRKGSFLTHVSKCLGMSPYACDMCSKTFTRQHQFVQHVQEMHNGVRPFKCDTCNKRFNSKSNLEIHSQVHAARLPTIYKCSLCQQMFNSSRKLRGHKIREHSLYRPYKCNTCKKLFLFKSQLSNHSKEHKVKEL